VELSYFLLVQFHNFVGVSVATRFWNDQVWDTGWLHDGATVAGWYLIHKLYGNGIIHVHGVEVFATTVRAPKEKRPKIAHRTLHP
jgi:hypothetical protein